MKDLLDPTKEELEHAASDMHAYQTIVKLMFPKQDELDDGALNIFNIFMTENCEAVIVKYSKFIDCTYFRFIKNVS